MLSNEQIFSYIMATTTNIQCNDGDDIRFILDQMDLYGANLLKQQSAGRHVPPLGHIILVLRQPIFVLFLLKLRA